MNEFMLLRLEGYDLIRQYYFQPGEYDTDNDDNESERIIDDADEGTDNE
jgi:hypothetical protein